MKPYGIPTLLLACSMGLMLMMTSCARAPLNQGASDSQSITVGARPVPGTAGQVVITDEALQHEVYKKWWHWFIGRKTLYYAISVDKLGADRSATNTLDIYVMMRNLTDQPLQIEARTQFMQANGTTVEKPTAWKRMYLPANGADTYRELSMSPEAQGYYVELRGGK